jgi:hypothetical protein
MKQEICSLASNTAALSSRPVFEQGIRVLHEDDTSPRVAGYPQQGARLTGVVIKPVDSGVGMDWDQRYASNLS